MDPPCTGHLGWVIGAYNAYGRKSVYKHKKQKLTTAKQEHRTRSQWHLNLRFNCSRWAKLPRNLPNY